MIPMADKAEIADTAAIPTEGTVYFANELILVANPTPNNVFEVFAKLLFFD